MAITSIFSTKQSKSTVHDQSDQHRKEATSDSIRSTQEQAKEGLQNVKNAINNGHGNGSNSNNNNNSNNNDGDAPIKDQIQDKAEDMRDTVGDAASAMRYSALHFAHIATGTTGLHGGKDDGAEQQNSITNSVVEAAGGAKERVYNYIEDTKDTLVSPQDHTRSKRNSESNNEHNEDSDKHQQGDASNSIAGTASQFKEKLLSISQVKSSEGEDHKHQSKQIGTINSDYIKNQVEAGKEQAADVTQSVRQAFSNLSIPSSANTTTTKNDDKHSNEDQQNRLMDTLKAKADEGRSTLDNQLDDLKGWMEGNTAEAKEYSASAKTRLAEEQMKEAHDLMSNAVKDRRDALEMRANQSTNLVKRSESFEEQNGKGGVLEGLNQKLIAGKDFVADHMTDTTIEAKEGLAARKQDLAEELFKEAREMTVEAKCDALKAVDLRKTR